MDQFLTPQMPANQAPMFQPEQSFQYPMSEQSFQPTNEQSFQPSIPFQNITQPPPIFSVIPNGLPNSGYRAIIVFQPTDITVLNLCPQDFHIIYPGMYLSIKESPFILVTIEKFVEARNTIKHLLTGGLGFTCQDLFMMTEKSSIDFWQSDFQELSLSVQSPLPAIHYFWLNDLPNAPLDKNGSIYKFLSTCFSEKRTDLYSDDDDLSSDEKFSDEEIEVEAFQFQPPSFQQ
jgi:hypothetical protein